MQKNANHISKSRPGANGSTKVEHFELQECELPSQELKHGHVIVENLYLSIDPAMASYYYYYLSKINFNFFFKKLSQFIFTEVQA